MAATSVPQLIAYAETVGYAGYRGLATAGPPLIAWGMATGSPFMNSGVTSITALMAKADLDGEAYLAEHGEDRYVELVAVYSLYVGLASIVLALVGFGKLAKSVPKPVRSGFKWGCSIGVLVSAIPNGLFMSGSKELKQHVAQSWLGPLLSDYRSQFPGGINVSNSLFAFTHPNLWGIEVASMFIIGTAFVMQGSKILPKALPPGSEVLVFVALLTLYSEKMGYQGGVVGEIPVLGEDAGLTIGSIRIPIEVVDIRTLLSEVKIVDQFGSVLMLALSALLFAAVNFLSIMGIASGFESENGIKWSAERELVAQGVSCAVAATVGSAPCSGSMSRSLVARMTGATSQVACIVTALCWIYLQPYMSVLTPTPKAALSAVVVSAVLKGIVVPKDLLKLSGREAFVAWLTGVCTACTSPTQGFGIGLLIFVVVRFTLPKEKRE